MREKLIRASDANSWAICRRRAWFDHNPPKAVSRIDPFDELIMEEGVKHEQRVMESIGPYTEALDEIHTHRLMGDGVERIYQGTYTGLDGAVICKPDLLTLEGGRYRPEDIKLSGDLGSKKAIRAQVGTYQVVLGTDLPGRVLLSSGETVEISEQDVKLAETFISDMRDILSKEHAPEAPFVASKCRGCPYSPTCVPDFEKHDEITRNYFVDARTVDRLADQGIKTLSDLAATQPESIEPIPWLKKLEMRQKAVLQAVSLKENRVIRIAEPFVPEGTPIHFDIETWPFGADGAGTVYLWGFLVPGYQEDDYEYVWGGASDDEDEAGWLTFLAQVERYRSQWPDMYLVHYTAFELTQIRRYAERYDMTDDPTVRWLLDDESACFDIKKAVSNNFILPVTSYGLKDICKPKDLVNFQWELEGSGSQWSVVRYRDWLNEKEPEARERIKQELLAYNRDDVRATDAVQVWIERQSMDGEVVDSKL